MLYEKKGRMARVEREWKRDKVWLVVIEERSHSFKFPREKCLDAFQIQNLASTLSFLPSFDAIRATSSFSISLFLNSKYLITYTCKIIPHSTSISLRKPSSYASLLSNQFLDTLSIKLQKGISGSSLRIIHIDLRAHLLF